MIMSLPLYVQSQEQVTDIEFYGVTSPTDVSKTVGFATYNGEQYMIQEKDSLLIYRFQDNIFVLHSILPNEGKKLSNFRNIEPNRSLFEIRGQYYYRFLYDGFEIVDLVQGEVVSRYDFSEDQISNFGMIEIDDKTMFFYGIFENRRYVYKYSFETDQLELLPTLPSRDNEIRQKTKIFGIEDDHKVFIYDIKTGIDSLIYESPKSIFKISYSRKNNNFYFVEENGIIWEINNDLQLQQLDCTIVDVDKFRSIDVRGNTAIVIYDHIDGFNSQYKVDVLNISSCQIVLTFITDPIAYFATGIQYVENEDVNSDFTIFGFYGFHPSDGFDLGLYYIIDHNQNTYTPIRNLSRIQSYTPFEYNNKLSFVGIHSSFWSTETYFYQYNIEAHNISQLDPNPIYKTNYTTLGFPANGNIVSCINTIDEEPAIWSLDENSNFEKIQSLDFTYNLGINYVSNIIPINNRIYFTSNGGLYSVYNEEREEVLFPKTSILHGYSYGTSMGAFGNILSVAEPNPVKTKFLRLNTELGTVDSLIDDNIYSTSLKPSAGPFIFYSKGNNQDTLKIYDTKTNSIINFPKVPYLIESWLIEGNNKASFVFRDDNPLFQIDYSTNEVTELYLDFFGDVKILAGSNNSFYVIEQDYQDKRTRVRIVKNNGNVELLYEGEDRFYTSWYQAGTAEYPNNFIGLASNGETVRIIVNDTNETEILELDHDFSSGYFSPFIHYKAGNLLIKTKVDNIENRYWIYNNSNVLDEIEIPDYDIFYFADFSDNILTFISRVNLEVKLLLYNMDSKISTMSKIENVCDYFSLNNGTAISDNEYVFSIGCINGYELWRLSIEDSTLYPYDEIYPGHFSSRPNNFTNHKNWIYFTAITKDNSRQWFRIENQQSTGVVDGIQLSKHKLGIYPSPATNSVRINENLSDLFIYSLDGKLISTQIQYLKDEAINISSLEIGTYLIVASNNNKEIVTGIFVKI